MPMYRFTCKAGHVTDEYRPLSRYREYIKCKAKIGTAHNTLIPCGLRSDITIATNLQVNTFKPYVEQHFDREPITVESRQQRDSLCAKHGVTYDTVKNFRKPVAKAAVEDITLGDVKQALETGRMPDGSKLDI